MRAHYRPLYCSGWLNLCISIQPDMKSNTSPGKLLSVTNTDAAQPAPMLRAQWSNGGQPQQRGAGPGHTRGRRSAAGLIDQPKRFGYQLI